MLIDFIEHRNRGIAGLYGGFFPALFGAIPSSALYFGVYEATKRKLSAIVRHTEFRYFVSFYFHSSFYFIGMNPDINRYDFETGALAKRVRPLLYFISAASGNAASSLLFVPKEFVKQQVSSLRYLSSLL